MIQSTSGFIHVTASSRPYVQPPPRPNVYPILTPGFMVTMLARAGRATPARQAASTTPTVAAARLEGISQHSAGARSREADPSDAGRAS